MKALKPYLFGWLSGLLVGLILMERWHRKGARHFLEADSVEQAVESDAANTSPQLSAAQPRASAVVVAAAKADAQSALQLVARVVPWGAGQPRPSPRLPR